MRKALNITIFALITVLVGFFSVNYYAHSKISYALAVRKKAVEFPDKYKAYTTVKCEPYDFSSNEYVFVGHRPERPFDVMFYDLISGDFINENYEFEYMGGATIENTTFPELLQMVKQDCSQFQESKGGPKDKTINWVYAEPFVGSPEPQMDEETKRVRRLSNAEDYMNFIYTNQPDELKALFHEIYGDPTQLEFFEKLELFAKIEEEGINQKYEEKRIIEFFTTVFNVLTDERKKAFIDTFGEWKDLPREELLKYAENAIFNFTYEERLRGSN